MSVAKSYVFTLNNYTAAEEAFLRALDCKYLSCGIEEGESGTPHLQGFVTFAKAMRMPACKKLLPRAHWETAIAREAASNYTRKEGNFFIIDNRSQGARTDLAACVASLKTGGIASVIEEHPEMYVKYHSGLEKLAFRFAPQRDFQPEVFWIWGSTGSGKTRSVVQKEPDLWISGRDLQWWDGYENQEAVLFDDFRGDFCKFHELLRLLDRYACRVAVKGGFRELNSKRMYITSCYPPNEVYKTREDINQLLRRISVVTELSNNIQL